MSCASSTCNSHSSIDFARAGGAATRASWLSKAWAGIVAMFDESRRRRVALEFEKVLQRGILLELDDRLLRDIGVTREEAVREAQKRFWK